MKKFIILLSLGMALHLQAQQERGLTPEEAAIENQATAQQTLQMSGEMTELEEAIRSGQMLSEPKPAIAPTVRYKVQSGFMGSNFNHLVNFRGDWEFDYAPHHRLIYISGGEIINQRDTETEEMLLEVYLSENLWDIQNPRFEGHVYAETKIFPIEAMGEESERTYPTRWIAKTDPSPGIYYPNLVLSEKNTETGEFEVIDIKVFEQTIEIE